MEMGSEDLVLDRGKEETRLTHPSFAPSGKRVHHVHFEIQRGRHLIGEVGKFLLTLDTMLEEGESTVHHLNTVLDFLVATAFVVIGFFWRRLNGFPLGIFLLTALIVSLEGLECARLSEFRKAGEVDPQMAQIAMFCFHIRHRNYRVMNATSEERAVSRDISFYT
ncbi:hypothetical protein TNCV_3653541 [Trichonephila clavipes]|nr:hypothetical protein TNCV_3653541 [Trichonephila clavipes]